MAETKNFKNCKDSIIYQHQQSSMKIHASPLSDCQTFSLSYVGGIINNGFTDEQILETLKEIYREVIGKKQFICNVPTEYYAKRIIDLCEPSGAIIFKQQYNSTRNSDMTMFLINVEKLIYKYENK